MTFANIRNNEIIDFNSKYIDEDIERIEVSDELFSAYQEDREKVIYKDGAVILNPDYETEKAQEEAERTAKLCLTAADVERALYKAFGKDFDDIIAMVETLQSSSSHSEAAAEESQETGAEKDSSLSAQNEEGSAIIDIKALKIELKANNFYRGNSYVDAIGAILGITSAQLDEFFESNDYTKLCHSEVSAEESQQAAESATATENEETTEETQETIENSGSHSEVSAEESQPVEETETTEKTTEESEV